MTNHIGLFEESAPQEVGIVLSKRGKVTAHYAGVTRILKRGDPIYSDDAVHTVRGANLQLQMQDKNIIMLRGGSTFRVNLYRMEHGLEQIKRFECSGGAIRISNRHHNNTIESSDRVNAVVA